MLKLIISFVIFMAAAGPPVYSQETSQVDAGQTTDSRFALIAGEMPAIPVSGTPAVPVRPAVPVSEKPAVPVSETRVVPVNETPDTSQAPTASPTQTASQTSTASPSPSAAPTPDASATPTPSPNASTPFVFPTPGERFNRYVKGTVGPFSLLRIAVSAGINQWRDNPEEWEQGMSGYGKRFASGFGRNAIQQTVIYGLDSAMGLDTRFRKSTRTGFFPRMKDALAENITSRTRTGKRVISVPRITGVYTSRIIAYEAWYPERYDYKDGLRSGTRSLLTGFGMNLVREFVINF